MIPESFWKRGAGAWMWLHEHTTMLILVPTDNDASGYVPVVIHTDRMPDDWSHAGPVHAWDGDVEAPTLTGSILAPYVHPPWHVFMRAGRFEPA